MSTYAFCHFTVGWRRKVKTVDLISVDCEYNFALLVCIKKVCRCVYVMNYSERQENKKYSTRLTINHTYLEFPLQ